MRVFESGIPITVINDTVTNKLWFGLRPPKRQLFGDDQEIDPEILRTKDPKHNPCVVLMQVSLLLMAVCVCVCMYVYVCMCMCMCVCASFVKCEPVFAAFIVWTVVFSCSLYKL